MLSAFVDAQLARTRRDRRLVGACLVLLVALAWLYLAILAEATAAMESPLHSSSAMWLMPMGEWGAREFALGLAMWMVMMVGMMVPSAAPMLFAYLNVSRSRPAGLSPIAATAAFLLGYLLVWGGFSVVATTAQWALHTTELLGPTMRSSSAMLNALLLIAAGVYQFLPIKNVCLSKCRLPLGFLLTEWRDGWTGAVRMGLRHGAFCVGCCWLLMALLFVAGVMNLLWIALLSAAVLVEKALPFGHQAARVVGVLTIAAGLGVLVLG
jgi:predicted metal-binding membrane protein